MIFSFTFRSRLLKIVQIVKISITIREILQMLRHFAAYQKNVMPSYIFMSSQNYLYSQATYRFMNPQLVTLDIFSMQSTQSQQLQLRVRRVLSCFSCTQRQILYCVLCCCLLYCSSYQRKKDIVYRHRAGKMARPASRRKITQPGEFCW